QLSQPQTGSRLGGRGDARDPAARIGFYQHELNRLPFAQYLSRVVNELLADLGKKHNCRQLLGAHLDELHAPVHVIDHPAQQLAWLIPCADDWRRSVPAPGRRRGAPTYRRLRRQVSKNDIPKAHASPATQPRHSATCLRSSLCVASTLFLYRASRAASTAPPPRARKGAGMPTRNDQARVRQKVS